MAFQHVAWLYVEVVSPNKVAKCIYYVMTSCCSQSQGDMMVLHYVAQILRQVVPLMEHPSESFLASLEEDLVKLVMKHGQMVSHDNACIYIY